MDYLQVCLAWGLRVVIELILPFTAASAFPRTASISGAFPIAMGLFPSLLQREPLSPKVPPTSQNEPNQPAWAPCPFRSNRGFWRRENPDWPAGSCVESGPITVWGDWGAVVDWPAWIVCLSLEPTT